jgi:hypothetical protein
MQLAGRRQRARAERPRDYAQQPRPFFTKATADFLDDDHRFYQILRDELSDVISLDSIPVYCRSSSGTRQPLMRVHRVGETIRLQALGPLRDVHGIRELRATLRGIGKHDPRGSFSGRLILGLESSGISVDMARSTAQEPPAPTRPTVGRVTKKSSAPRHIPGAPHGDRWPSLSKPPH